MGRLSIQFLKLFGNTLWISGMALRKVFAVACQVIVLLLLTLTGCTQNSYFDLGSTPEPGLEQERARLKKKIGHEWPPVKDQEYPDLELRDHTGKQVKLSQFRGKVIILQPVGTTSTGSIGLTGGDTLPPFQGMAPQAGLPSIDELLEKEGVDPNNPNLIRVDILFYRSMSDEASLEDAQAWVEHFGLRNRENAIVLVGDERYLDPVTLNMIPGFQLIDQDFKLRVDSAGREAPDNMLATFVPAAWRLLQPKLEIASPFPEDATDPLVLEWLDLLESGRFAEVDHELAVQRERGRIQESFDTYLDKSVLALIRSERARRTFDNWCQASLNSPYAFWVRGEFGIRHGWEARGTGFSDSVTSEDSMLFGERLRQAREDLNRSHELDPTFPNAASALVTVSMGLSLPDSEWSRYFNLTCPHE